MLPQLCDFNNINNGPCTLIALNRVTHDAGTVRVCDALCGVRGRHLDVQTKNMLDMCLPLCNCN